MIKPLQNEVAFFCRYFVVVSIAIIDLFLRLANSGMTVLKLC